MNDAEENALHELGNELASAMHSAWEPACIARAFASSSLRTFRFTMQTWINLEAIRSPVLQGDLPETALEFQRTLIAFGCAEKEELTADEMIALARDMIETIAEAFAMALPMKPGGDDGGKECAEGFGRWLPIYCALKTQCGFSHVETMALEVAQAFAVIAGLRRNQGWECAGEVYALREASNG
jgi:hypothetical protein